MPKHELGFVGSKHRPKGVDIVRQMDDRHPVLLVREPENPYDPNAIAVYVQIGYVPKAQAAAGWADQLDTLVPRRTVAAMLVARSKVEVITPRPNPQPRDLQAHAESDDEIPF